MRIELRQPGDYPDRCREHLRRVRQLRGDHVEHRPSSSITWPTAASKIGRLDQGQVRERLRPALRSS